MESLTSGLELTDSNVASAVSGSNNPSTEALIPFEGDYEVSVKVDFTKFVKNRFKDGKRGKKQGTGMEKRKEERREGTKERRKEG